MRALLITALLALLLVPAVLGQTNTVYSTTTGAAVGTKDVYVTVASTANMQAPTETKVGSLLFVDRELMQVIDVPSTTRVHVTRYVPINGAYSA